VVYGADAFVVIFTAKDLMEILPHRFDVTDVDACFILPENDGKLDHLFEGIHA